MAEKIGALRKRVTELYSQGYSQKDISQMLQVSPSMTRNILQKEGFQTRKFRSLDENVTSVLLLLVSSGVPFADIEEICDISFHAIREVVVRHNMQYVSRRVRGNGPGPILQSDFERNVEFHQYYLKGESFCQLCETFDLRNEQILNEFLSIDKDEISIHKDHLRKNILSDVEQGFSLTAIAKRNSISMSLVRKILHDSKAPVGAVASDKIGNAIQKESEEDPVIL